MSLRSFNCLTRYHYHLWFTLDERHFVAVSLIKLNNNNLFPMFKMIGVLFEVMLRYSYAVWEAAGDARLVRPISLLQTEEIGGQVPRPTTSPVGICIICILMSYCQFVIQWFIPLISKKPAHLMSFLGFVLLFLSWADEFQL